MLINACLRLLWMLCLTGSATVWAEPLYPDASSVYGRPQQSGFHQGRYHWRPLEEGNGPSAPQLPRIQAPVTRGAPDYRDYADTPSGLPRGIYRPVQDRHEITPHYQGFRFRPLSPEEQVRIKKRNTTNRDSNKQQETVFRPLRPAAQGGESGIVRQGRYRFRPDKRLDGTVNRVAPAYTPEPAFTEAYPAPVFRRSDQ